MVFVVIVIILVVVVINVVVVVGVVVVVVVVVALVVVVCSSLDRLHVTPVALRAAIPTMSRTLRRAGSLVDIGDTLVKSGDTVPSDDVDSFLGEVPLHDTQVPTDTQDALEVVIHAKCMAWMNKTEMETSLGEERAHAHIQRGKLEMRADPATGLSGEWDAQYKVKFGVGGEIDDDSIPMGEGGGIDDGSITMDKDELHDIAKHLENLTLAVSTWDITGMCELMNGVEEMLVSSASLISGIQAEAVNLTEATKKFESIRNDYTTFRRIVEDTEDIAIDGTPEKRRRLDSASTKQASSMRRSWCTWDDLHNSIKELVAEEEAREDEEAVYRRCLGKFMDEVDEDEEAQVEAEASQSEKVVKDWMEKVDKARRAASTQASAATTPTAASTQASAATTLTTAPTQASKDPLDAIYEEMLGCKTSRIQAAAQMLLDDLGKAHNHAGSSNDQAGSHNHAGTETASNDHAGSDNDHAGTATASNDHAGSHNDHAACS